MLKPNVTAMPCNRSTMKKRFSFCAKVDLGTGTNGITTNLRFSISNFQLQPGLELRYCPTVFTDWRASPRLKVLTHHRHDCRSALRRINQTNLPPLFLQIEIARSPINQRQDTRSHEQVSKTKNNRDRFSTDRQTQSGFQRLDRAQPSRVIKALNHSHADGGDHDVDKRGRQHPFPTEIHELIVTEPRKRPTQPEV